MVEHTVDGDCECTTKVGSFRLLPVEFTSLFVLNKLWVPFSCVWFFCCKKGYHYFCYFKCLCPWCGLQTRNGGLLTIIKPQRCIMPMVSLLRLWTIVTEKPTISMGHLLVTAFILKPSRVAANGKGCLWYDWWQASEALKSLESSWGGWEVSRMKDW